MPNGLQYTQNNTQAMLSTPEKYIEAGNPILCLLLLQISRHTNTFEKKYNVMLDIM